jgi:hypothetical protein
MSDEFEDRENAALGELPTPIETERREFSQTDADKVPVQIPPPLAIGQQGANAAIPPDIQKQADALQGGQGRIGSPVIPATVTSVYDGRPVNARDFKVTDVQTLNGDNDANPPAQTLDVDYEVPLGFVGVLRGFQFQPFVVPNSPIKNTNDNVFNWVEVSILINGIVQQDYSQLKFGATMDRAQEIFIVASELQIITLRVKFLSAFILAQSLVVLETTPVRLEMYGNNLLTRGLPTPFEIATQVKTGTNVADKEGK